MLTRRHFIRTTTALFAASAASPLMASTWPDAAQKAAWDAEVEAGTLRNRVAELEAATPNTPGAKGAAKKA